MSMKVFNAFRLNKPKDLWPLLWKIQDQAEQNVREALSQHYWKAVCELDPDSETYQAARQQDQTTPEAIFRLTVVNDELRKGYRLNSTKMDQSTYSLDCTIAIYPHRNQFYLRTFVSPISIVGSALDFVPQMRELEDFHYQNQADRPAEVSARQWSDRKRIWNQITQFQGIGRHVVLDIVNTSNLWRLDPYRDLARSWHVQPPTLPSREEVWAGRLRELQSLVGVQVEVREGFIQARGYFTIRKEDEFWNVGCKGQKRTYATLNQAADYVMFEYLPESTKSMVRHMMGMNTKSP